MNARQRRSLRRWAKRTINKNSFTGEEREVSDKLALICRASISHSKGIIRGQWVGAKRERHLFKVLDDHRFEHFGLRHEPLLKEV